MIFILEIPEEFAGQLLLFIDIFNSHAAFGSTARGNIDFAFLAGQDDARRTILELTALENLIDK